MFRLLCLLAKQSQHIVVHMCFKKNNNCWATLQSLHVSWQLQTYPLGYEYCQLLKTPKLSIILYVDLFFWNMWLYYIPLLSTSLHPSLFTLWLLHLPSLLPLPLGCYILWSGEEHSLCFCSNWMRWAELCQCPHHLLLSRVQEEGGSGVQRERK